MNALIALERLRIQRGSSLWLGFALAALIASAGVAARYASGQSGAIETSIDLGLSHLLAYLLPYLFCSGMIAEEVSARTLGFLTSRPVPRAQIVIGKWIVGTAACAAVLLAACLVLHIGGTITQPSELARALPHTLGTWCALVLQTGVYAALGLFYGALAPSAAAALLAFHLLFLEAALSLAPGPLRLLSLAHHSAELADLPRHGIMSESVRMLPGFAHALVLCFVIAALLATAIAIFKRSEYRASEHD